jgi:CubicO group peptidase (beta-lactamase class C family)
MAPRRGHRRAVLRHRRRAARAGRAATGFGLPLSAAFWHTPTAFGTTGRGGSTGFADPAAGPAFGYVTNHLIDDPTDQRAANLVAAVRKSLPA